MIAFVRSGRPPLVAQHLVAVALPKLAHDNDLLRLLGGWVIPAVLQDAVIRQLFASLAALRQVCRCRAWRARARRCGQLALSFG